MADNLWDMSDADLEAAFKEAKASMNDEVYQETYVEEENEVVEDLEQPEEDSDDDTSDADEDGIEEEENSEVTDDLDGEKEEAEEQLDESEEEATEVEQPVQKRRFRANGKEYEFTDEEIMSQFPKIFGQAMDYTKKTQAIKGWRKTIDALESAQLSHDDINLAIDVLKGDKGAISTILKKNKIDSLDLDMEDTSYKPKDYGRDENTLAIHDVIEEISGDDEYKITNRILSKEWDNKSFAEVTQDPSIIKALHVDVKNGVYHKVSPIAEKLKVYDGGRKSDLEYYLDAGRIYYTDLEQEKARLVEADKARAEIEQRNAEKARLAEVKAKQEQAKAVKQESEKRKAATPTKRSVGTKKALTNYLDASDEEFEEWYAKLQDNR